MIINWNKFRINEVVKVKFWNLGLVQTLYSASNVKTRSLISISLEADSHGRFVRC